MRQLLSHPDEQTRERLAPYLSQTDAIDYAQRRAESYSKQAGQQLELLPDSPAKRVLAMIAEFAARRSF